MKTALLAAGAVLALACSAQASEYPDSAIFPSNTCRVSKAGLIRTTMTEKVRLDCCPVGTKCAGHLGTTIVPERRQRLQG